MNRLFSLCCAFLLAGLAVTPVHAQDRPLTAAERQKLDGAFQMLLSTPAPAPMAKRSARALPLPVLEATAVTHGGTVRFPAIVHTTNVTALRQAGISVGSVFAGRATVRATRRELRTLAGLSAVRRIETATMAHSHNDETAREVGARTLNNGAVNNTAYQGAGVITCVIDSGIDYDHGDFVDANGDTRILFLWDQTASTTTTPADRDASFSGLDYGAEYTAADINAGTVSATDTDGHGTHVAGTAASSGYALVNSGAQATPEHRGMAPKADIVVVKAGNGSFPNTNIIDGMTYCGQVAANQNKPVVVNMSLGSQGGPHDGTSALDLAVDAFTDGTPNDGSPDPGTAPNRVAVVSAGNDGGSSIHVSGSLGAGATANEPWTVGEYTPKSGAPNDYFLTEYWLDGNGPLTITVTAPNGTDQLALSASGTGPQAVGDSTGSGIIYIESGVDGDNNDRYVSVIVYDIVYDEVQGANQVAPAEGQWSIQLTNNGTASTGYHGWTTATQTLTGSFDNGNGQYTIGTPGSAAGAITVGAHVHRWRWTSTDGSSLGYDQSFDLRDDIAPFSSIGPLRDGALKPDLTAPGMGTVSAYSQDMSNVSSLRIIDQDGLHRLSQGTSMSAPAVAGSVALLLEAAMQAGQSLTANEVRTYLTDAADTDTYTTQYGAMPNPVFGHGKLDILEAVTNFLGGSAQREYLIYHDPYTLSELTGHTLGGTGAERLALRFTPSISGVVTGALLTPGPAGSIQLTQPLNVEVWSSSSAGLPDTKLGATTVPPEQLTAFGPNSVDLVPTGVQVQANTDYFVVLTPSGPGSLTMQGEAAGSTSGRSGSFDGTSWSPLAADLILRPQIAATSGIASALPVELVAFNAVSTANGARLSWRTASETNNAGFYVDHKAPTAEAFTNLSFVAGAGTASAPQTYQFAVADLAPGTHTFRLRQKDVDGTSTDQWTTTVTIDLRDAFRLSKVAPNPLTRSGRATLYVQQRQKVTAALYNVLGQRVRVLHDGAVPPKQALHLPIAADQLASGMYFLRVRGERFQATQKVMIVR